MVLAIDFKHLSECTVFVFMQHAYTQHLEVYHKAWQNEIPMAITMDNIYVLQNSACNSGYQLENQETAHYYIAPRTNTVL
jgi:hypothetical protein